MLTLMCILILAAWFLVTVVDYAQHANGPMRSIVLGSIGAVCLSVGGGGFLAFLTGEHTLLTNHILADDVTLSAEENVQPPEPKIEQDSNPPLAERPPTAEAPLVDSPLPVEDAEAPESDESTATDAAATSSAPTVSVNEEETQDTSANDRDDTSLDLVDANSAVRIDETNRPGWVNMVPLRNGDVHATSVCSGPFLTQQESLDALDIELKVQVDEYVNEYLQSKLATSYPTLNFGIERIKSDLVSSDKVYHEMVGVSLGDMHQTHALLEFDQDFRNELDARWNRVVKANHLVVAGVGIGGVLLALGLVVSYFRLDTATRGFYTGRLQFATAVAILGLIAAAALLANWIPWI